MAKNMTQKSLAIGAGFALAATGLVATPANAAISAIEIAPISGTSQTGIQGADFIFIVNAKGNAGESLTIVLEDIEESDITSLVVESTADISDAGAIDMSSGTELVGSDSGDIQDNSTTGDAFASFTAVAGEYSVFALDIKDAEFTASETVTVKVIEEASSTKDGVYVAALDGAQSSGFDVTFVEPDTVTANVSVTAPSLGDDNASADVTLNGVNNASINHASKLFKVGFELDGAAAVDTNVTASDYDDVFEVDAGSALANASAGSVTFANVYILSETTKAGSGNATTGAAGKVATLSGVTVANGQAGKTSGDVIRAEGSHTITASVTAVDSSSVPVAGATVTFKLTEGSALKGTVKAGGKSLTNASTSSSTESISVTATTNASGKATLDISWTDLTAADNFTIDASTPGASSLTPATQKTLTAAKSVATKMQALVGDRYEIVKDGSVSIPGKLVDQFGLAPKGTFRVKFTAAGQSALANVVKYASVGSDGSFTMSWTDNSTAAGTGTLTLNDVEKDVSGTWTSQSTESATDTVTLVVVKAANTVARVSTAKSTGSSDKDPISTSSLINYDGLSVNQTQPSALSDNETITATVFNADGSAANGAAVTFSGAGVQFEGTTQGVREYGVGSWTGYTDSSGQVAVEYISNLSGKVVITATSGAFSDTETITFAAPDANAGVQWVLGTAPTNVKAGGQFIFTATLVDKYGNGVTTSGSDVTVTQSGAGAIVGTTPTDTDANGQVRLAILVGENETGSVTIELASTQTLDDIELKHVVTIGADAVAVEQKVNAGSFKGYVAVYARGYEGQRLSAKIGNDWVIVDPIVNNQENGTLHRTVDFTGAGYNIAVRIYIDRVLVDTINLTTK